MFDKLITFAEKKIKELEAQKLPKNSTRDNRRVGSLKAFNEMLTYMKTEK